jgi:hypothetical protein
VYSEAIIFSGEYNDVRDGIDTVDLFCATTTAVLSLHVSLISKTGLKSGHLSPANERGAVRISVKMSMREKYLSISIASKSGCQAVGNSIR